MITIINEKSSQADDFAKALGGRSGVLPDDSTLAGESYAIQEAAGHLTAFKPLTEMVPEDRIDEFTSWDYNTLPFDRGAIHFQKVLNPDALGKGAKYYMSEFKKLLAESDAVVIATDNDPSGEGDMIGWEIIDYCNFHGDVYRCENFENGIKKAFTKLRKVTHQDGLLKRAEARQKFDYFTIQYVRIATDEARKQQVLPSHSLIGEGRLQTAMVHLIGYQEELHNSFVPSSVFQPALFDKDGHKFLRKGAPFYKTKEEAEQHLDSLPLDPKIQEVNKQKLATKPPKMMDLSKVSSVLEARGYNSNEIQKLAEDMYTAKYLSYPRTEDSKITHEQLNLLLPHVEHIADLVGVDKNLIDLNGFRESQIDDKNTTHGANRPSEKKVPDSLDEIKEQFGETGVALYVELAKSFLAEFAPDKISERHIYSDDKTGQYKATATVVLKPGWSEIINSDTKKDDEEDDSKLLEIGGELTHDIYEKKATRPGLATSTTLNNFLTKNNIGTGATRLNTYNKIKDSKNKGRQLVQSKKGKLTLTKLGVISYLLMQKTKMASVSVTKDLETTLKDIQKGTKTEDDLFREFDKMIMSDKDIMIKNQAKLSSLPKVKQAGHLKVHGTYSANGPLTEYRGQEVSFSDGYSTHKFTEEEIKELLDGKEIVITLKKGSKEFKVKGCLKDHRMIKENGEDKAIGFGFAGELVREPRPQAKGIYVPKGEEITFDRKFGQHMLTDDEVKQVLNGDVIKFETRSKANKKYTARLKLAYTTGYKTNKKAWRLVFDDDGSFKSKGGKGKKKYAKK